MLNILDQLASGGVSSAFNRKVFDTIMETESGSLRFKNLGLKIKFVREKVLRRALGRKITQSEFCTFFPIGDDESGKTLQRSTVARWEAVDERVRTEPQRKYLRMLAEKTDDPAHYFYWFLDDEVSLGDEVEYAPDGTRVYLTTSAELERINKQHEAIWEAHQEAEQRPKVPEGLGAEAFHDEAAATALMERLKTSYRAKFGERGIGALQQVQKQHERQLAEQEELKFNQKILDFWPAVRHKLRRKNIDVEGVFDRTHHLGPHLSVKTEYRDAFSAILFASVSKNTPPAEVNRKIMTRIGALATLEMASGPTNKLLVIVAQDPQPAKNLPLMEIIASINELPRMRAVVTSPDEEDRMADYVYEFIDAGSSEERRKKLPLVIPPSE